MLNLEIIKEYLAKASRNIPKIVFFDETDSTNTRAREFARSRTDSDRSPVVFIARSQTAGRGRRGRSFSSESGGIYMSVLTYPREGCDPTSVTAFAAVVASRAIGRLSGAKVGIKWVNDLYIGNKKLAGILTEGEFDENGNLTYSVCGMGINVYKTAFTDDVLAIATSLEAEGIMIDINLLASEIITEFLAGYEHAVSEENLAEYKERSIVLGRDITVIRGDESFIARAIRILPDYSLLVRRPDGTEVRVLSGEVSTKI